MNDVFISYSRRDKVFTQKLYEALTAANRTVWADWDSIPAASDWDAEIKQGIQETNSVLFVLSPEWIKSNECRKEMVHAVTMGKRLFPILYLPVDPNDVPPELAKINWVYMRDSDDFDKAFQTLCSAMDTDLNWIKTHTRIQVRALEWERKKRDHSFVLRGNDLTEGEQFISGATGKSPEPTQLQGEYILASRTDATRRQRQTLAGVTVALIVSIVLGVVAFFQRQEAVKQSQISLARQLAAQAQLLDNEDDSKQMVASLLSIQSMKLYPTGDAAGFLQNKNLAAQIVSQMNQGGSVIAVAYNPDGRYVASVWCDEITTGYFCNTTRNVSIWEANSGKMIHRFMNVLDKDISNITFSPDGNNLILVDIDEKIHVVDVETGKENLTMAENIPTNYLRNLNPEPTSSRFSLIPEELGSGFSLKNLETDIEILRIPHKEEITSAFLSPDENYVVATSANGVVRVWETATGSEVARMTHDNKVYSAVFSPNGKYVVSGGYDGIIRVWEPMTSQDVFYFYPYSSTKFVGIVKDGNIISPVCLQYENSLCKKGVISTWEIGNGKEVNSIPFDKPVSTFSHDGKYAASVQCAEFNESLSCIHSIIYIYDGVSGGEVSHQDGDEDMGFSPDSSLVVSKVCDLESGDKCSIQVWKSATGEIISLVDINVHVSDLAFSPKGTYVVSKIVDSVTSEEAIVVWDALTMDEKLRIHSSAQSLNFSPDEHYTIIGYGDSATVWDIDTGKEIAHLDHAKVENQSALRATGLLSVAFSPDGKYIATGSADKTVRVWEAATGQQIALMTHDSEVTDVAFSPDGKSIVSRTYEGNTYVWEVATGKKITYKNDGKPRGRDPFSIKIESNALFSPDGRYVIVNGHVWMWQPKDIIANACEFTPRNLTRAEWEQFIGDAMSYQAVCENLPIEPEVTSTPTVTP